MTLPIYTIDTETDPFRFGRVPKPFAIGFYDGETYSQFWGDDCVSHAKQHIETLKPGIIYAHNGGRFDIYFFMDWVLGNPMRIINSRIVKSKMKCDKGFHEIRDSFAIMPFALSKAKGKTQKASIDISKMEKESREQHKEEISSYLKIDCVSLWELCTDFIDEYGPMLTIGSTAMKELKKIHSFDNLEPTEDNDLRKNYYYGGRVQCFEKGVLRDSFKVYDVNSMYPSVMKNALHPIGRPSSEGTSIKDDTCFISLSGYSHGCFPVRTKNGGIDFPVGFGTYHVTRHEFDAAFELGLFDIQRIYRCINFHKRASFSDFVDHFYNKRIEANLSGDGNQGIFCKLILNSAYGKFSQNPDNYEEYRITDVLTDLHSQGWNAREIKYGNYIVWSKPSRDASRYNVAIGASITGAARSILMRGIASASRPIYCDTDSIICTQLDVEKDNFKLGAWKLESQGTLAGIAGKKLYVLWDGDKVVKQANKGVKLKAEEIMRVCLGESVVSQREAPTFKLDGSHVFIERKVRMT